MAYKSYRDLNIYKLAYKLSVEVHRVSLKFRKFELYELGSQVRRSSHSVRSNIVEGFGRRRYRQEFIRFLTYSLASCDETRDHLNALFDTGSFDEERKYKELSDAYDHLGRMITNFIRTVEKTHKVDARV